LTTKAKKHPFKIVSKAGKKPKGFEKTKQEKAAAAVSELFLEIDVEQTIREIRLDV